MKPRYRQRRRIPHIVKVCRSYQQIAILYRDHRSNTAGTLRDLLNVQPAIAQRGQEALCARRGPRDQGHADTLPLHTGQTLRLGHRSGRSHNMIR